MKPKTRMHSIRLSEQTLEIWQTLKDHKIRVAEIFKEAGEKAILKKFEDLKLNYCEETLPF